MIPLDDSSALIKIPSRYHPPLTTFGCIHTKNARVVNDLSETVISPTRKSKILSVPRRRAYVGARH